MNWQFSVLRSAHHDNCSHRLSPQCYYNIIDHNLHAVHFIFVPCSILPHSDLTSLPILRGKHCSPLWFLDQETNILRSYVICSRYHPNPWTWDSKQDLSDSRDLALNHHASQIPPQPRWLLPEFPPKVSSGWLWGWATALVLVIPTLELVLLWMVVSGWGAPSWTLEGFPGHLSLGGMTFQWALLALGIGYPIGNMKRIILLKLPAKVSICFFEIINGRNLKKELVY